MFSSQDVTSSINLPHYLLILLGLSLPSPPYPCVCVCVCRGRHTKEPTWCLPPPRSHVSSPAAYELQNITSRTSLSFPVILFSFPSLSLLFPYALFCTSFLYRFNSSFTHLILVSIPLALVHPSFIHSFPYYLSLILLFHNLSCSFHLSFSVFRRILLALSSLIHCFSSSLPFFFFTIIPLFQREDEYII